MKRLLLIALLNFSFFIIYDCYAEIPEGHLWEVGVEISHLTYKESGNFEEKGYFYGIDGAYSYHGGLTIGTPVYGQTMFKIEGRASYGQVDYETLTIGEGEIDNIDNYVVEFRGLGGYDFSISESFTVTPYIGFGYRYLNDDATGNVATDGTHTYEREMTYLYSPIGVEADYDLDENWSIGGNVEYDVLLWGEQISHLSDWDPHWNDPENRLKTGFGVRSALKLKKKGEKIDISLEPFIRYWRLSKAGDAIRTYAGSRRPDFTVNKNTSTEFGMKVLIKY